MLKGIKNHKKGILLISIPIIVFICVWVYSKSYLSSIQYFTDLALYGNPVCSYDKTTFKSDTCEACSKSITETGVFYSLENEDFSKDFTEYYDSYDAFYSEYSDCLTISAVVTIIFAFECFYFAGLLIITILKRNKIKNKK